MRVHIIGGLFRGEAGEVVGMAAAGTAIVKIDNRPAQVLINIDEYKKEAAH